MTDPEEATTTARSGTLTSVHDRFTSKTLAVARFLAQRALLKPLVWSLLRVEIVGRAKLRTLNSLRGGFIVVANHSSHLDAPLITCALPRPLSRYLATAAAGDYFFEVWWRRGLTALFFNAFPVDRSAKRAAAGAASETTAARQSAARTPRNSEVRRAPADPRTPRISRPVSTKTLLRRGIPVLVFPEGTRSRDGELGNFQPGAAALAASCEVPLLPVALVGAHEAQPRGASWPKAGRPAVRVVFGDPMHPSDGEEPKEFIERIKTEILRLRQRHEAGSLAHAALPKKSGPSRPASSKGASA